MKTRTIAFLAFILTSVFLFGNSDSSGYKVIGKSGSELFESKIQKVYSFKNGALEYVSFVVVWNGYEVVVAPTFLTEKIKKYRVGDVIKCSMSFSENQSSANMYPNLRFVVADDFPNDEAARLKYVEDEIKRRRMERDQAESKK